MVTHAPTRSTRRVVAASARMRTRHVCRSCGGRFVARPGEHLAAVFCAACLDQVDDPVTAEHAWDLGGGD